MKLGLYLAVMQFGRSARSPARLRLLYDSIVGQVSSIAIGYAGPPRGAGRISDMMPEARVTACAQSEDGWAKGAVLNAALDSLPDDIEIVVVGDMDFFYAPTYAKAVRGAIQDGAGCVLAQAWMCPEGLPLPHTTPEDYEALRSVSYAASREHKGVQAFRAAWLRSARFDEGYQLWGGPDEEVVERARQDGLEIRWLDGGLCLHQWHTLKSDLAKDQSAYAFRRHANQARYKLLLEKGQGNHADY